MTFTPEGRHSFTIAAPIDFFGTKAPLGVVVQVFNNGRGDKSLYIHEICDSEGNYIELDNGVVSKKEISNTGEVDSSSTAGIADDGNIPKNSIRNEDGIVKSESLDFMDAEIQRTIPKTEAEISEEQVAQAGRDLEAGAKLSDRIVNGNHVVWIEENILKQNTENKPVHQYIADYIADHIGEVYTIIESGQKVYLGEDLPGEYTQSKYTQGLKIERAS